MKKLPYPKQYANKEIYIKVPQEIDGKWFAVNVTEKGKTIPSPVYQPFKTKRQCQHPCNLHNTHHGWDKEKVRIILKLVGYEKS